jgi:hypothetical protein
MGWGFAEYEAQPEWFVDAIMVMMRAEADAVKRAQDRQNHGN